MNKKWMNVGAVILMIAVIVVMAWGPEAVSEYRSNWLFNQIWVTEAGEESEGYRYTLTTGEKIYILSRALNSQVASSSEQNSLLQGKGELVDYDGLTGSYAFVLNRETPGSEEITEEEIYDICNEQLAALKQLGILPDSVQEVDEDSYSATRYSAIYVSDPQNNVVVWHLELETTRNNSEKKNRLIDAYIDADTGKIYEFYVRTDLTWEQIDPDLLIREWADYMELEELPEAYETLNPLTETTRYYQKYSVAGMDGEETVVTLGFYEGINELFLKISR